MQKKVRTSTGRRAVRPGAVRPASRLRAASGAVRPASRLRAAAGAHTAIFRLRQFDFSLPKNAMSLFFLRRSAWEVQSGKSIEERKGKLLQSDVLELGDIEIRMPEQRHVYSCIHISSYVYLFFIVVLHFFGGSILYPPPTWQCAYRYLQPKDNPDRCSPSSLVIM